jgi:hypothetical protein
LLEAQVTSKRTRELEIWRVAEQESKRAGEQKNWKRENCRAVEL